MFDGFPTPGIGSYVNANRAIIGTNPALYAAGIIGHYMSRRQYMTAVRVSSKNIIGSHGISL
jgi:hypothetical protein